MEQASQLFRDLIYTVKQISNSTRDVASFKRSIEGTRDYVKSNPTSFDGWNRLAKQQSQLRDSSLKLEEADRKLSKLRDQFLLLTEGIEEISIPINLHEGTNFVAEYYDIIKKPTTGSSFLNPESFTVEVKARPR
jgi:hypothetical protein